MAIPKKHKERVEKFVRIVLERVTNETVTRVFNQGGILDADYRIAIYSVGLLPRYNDDRIELSGDINGKKIGVFIISGESLSNHKLDDALVNEVVDAYMKLRIK